ncbi:hypothetical protein MJM83_32815, partial [Salmonella enterica subsp. enterica serovar Montevideo]|nr:hypothetical protein [Salmonella enterica subsp. enterica serovar Montevideo]
TNDPMTLVRWLTAGTGIAYVPLMWVIDEINRGDLEILLPRYQFFLPEMEVTYRDVLIYRARKSMMSIRYSVVLTYHNAGFCPSC